MISTVGHSDTRALESGARLKAVLPAVSHPLLEAADEFRTAAQQTAERFEAFKGTLDGFSAAIEPPIAEAKGISAVRELRSHLEGIEACFQEGKDPRPSEGGVFRQALQRAGYAIASAGERARIRDSVVAAPLKELAELEKSLVGETEKSCERLDELLGGLEKTAPAEISPAAIQRYVKERTALEGQLAAIMEQLVPSPGFSTNDRFRASANDSRFRAAEENLKAFRERESQIITDSLDRGVLESITHAEEAMESVNEALRNELKRERPALPSGAGKPLSELLLNSSELLLSLRKETLSPDCFEISGLHRVAGRAAQLASSAAATAQMISSTLR